MDLCDIPDTSTLEGREIYFDFLYKKYANGVYANIYKLIKDVKTCEDILQDVFIALWNNLPYLNAGQNIPGWLFVVSYNKAKTQLKKRLKESISLFEDIAYVAADIAEEIADNTTYEEQLGVINKALDHLSAQKRTVFILNKYEGLSVDEIAVKMQLKRQTVVEYLKQSVQFIKKFAVRHRASLSKTSLVVLLELL